MTEPPPVSTTPSPSAAGLQAILPSWHDAAFIGPLMFGTLLQFGIFCILVMQAVVFFARQRHGHNDGWLFQLRCALYNTSNGLQVNVGLWHLYNTCVLLQPWSVLPHAWLEAMLNGIVVESVHGFFIFRCYKLSRSKRILSLILVMAISQIAAAIVATVCQAKAARPVELRTSTFVLTTTTLALDIVISATLFVNLWRQRTGQAEVDTVILGIIRMTVESIVPCLICLTLILISASSLGMAPGGSLFSFATPLVAPLYANALLTTLNSRPALRRQLDSDRHNGQISIHDDIRFANSNQSRRTSYSNSWLADPVRRGGTSHDIALADTIGLSNGGGDEWNKTISNARSLVPDDDTIPDLCLKHTPTLLSGRAPDSPLLLR